MNDGEQTWPKVLRDDCGVEVRDFSHVGATVKSAMSQAERVDGSGLVLLEIGGNDLLGPGSGTPPSEFAKHLDALLDRVASNERTTVMLELPLPPFANEFGAIQRGLARRHGVLLIPKRSFLAVLTTEGATVDGIHLSPAGHRQMAEAIARLLGIESLTAPEVNFSQSSTTRPIRRSRNLRASPH
jgi:acyl-CoA thioesterase-1